MKGEVEILRDMEERGDERRRKSRRQIRSRDKKPQPPWRGSGLNGGRHPLLLTVRTWDRFVSFMMVAAWAFFVE
jgi:hypothetical protein